LPRWLAALLAMDAVVLVEGQTGPKEVPLQQLLEGQVEGDISALRVPPEGPNRCWGEAHVARTPADEPIVAAIAVVTVTDDVVQQARVALTGVWPGPVRLAHAPARLVGGPLTGERIQAVADAVAEEVAPEGDYLGSAAYRRAMAGVVTRRALEQCMG
jgi:CO/xanthine dehydrogenase FAD-binding subunit